MGTRVSGLLPAPVGRRLAAVGGSLAALVDSGERRALVRRHQQRAGAGPVAPAYRAYARYWYESFRLPTLPEEEVATEFSFDGVEHIQRGLAAGNGVILALPHLGGWEWAAFWVASVVDAPVSAVVERLESDEVFEWFADFRASYGVHVIPLGEGAATQVAKALKANHVVALLGDRDIAGSGLDVEFFGEQTKVPAGIVTLGLRSGAPILPTAVYFKGTGHCGHVTAPLDTDRLGRFRDDVGRITQDLTARLENLVRHAPAQWHLMSPNWPSDLEPGTTSG